MGSATLEKDKRDTNNRFCDKAISARLIMRDNAVHATPGGSRWYPYSTAAQQDMATDPVHLDFAREVKGRIMKVKSLLTCLIGALTLMLPSTSVAAAQASGRQLPAVNYRARSGSTNIDFKGTDLMPAAKGKAKVESKQGYVSIEAEFEKLGPATTFGNEYLSYVLWTVTPEGQSASLGELIFDGTKSELKVTTRLQTFAIFVTAEPYFAVSQPSQVVVLENVLRETTAGAIVMVSPKSELVGGGYAPSGYKFDPIGVASGQAPELIQIQNARRIAKLAGADKYASQSFEAAEATYRQVAEYAVQKKTPTKALITSARQAI